MFCECNLLDGHAPGEFSDQSSWLLESSESTPERIQCFVSGVCRASGTNATITSEQSSDGLDWGVRVVVMRLIGGQGPRDCQYRNVAVARAIRTDYHQRPAAVTVRDLAHDCKRSRRSRNAGVLCILHA